LYQTETIFEKVPDFKKTLIKEADMKRISSLNSPSLCLAVFKIPKTKPSQEIGLVVALDTIRDPGNLGTIIRLCDWFGIKELWCSKETVDVFNPKVVQATMGSLTRVSVHYMDLSVILKKTSLPIFGTFMDGKSIYETTLPVDAILVLGNEANGISSDLEKMITNRVAIPRFGDLQQTESLNVATATAIFLSEISEK
jgi:TrmH family RNA methyltransferase